MVWAISSGVAARLAGIIERKPALASSLPPAKRSSMAVATGPGATEVLDAMLDQAAHFGLMAHVGTQVLGADAKGAQFGCKGLAGFVAAAGHNHARAFTSKGQRSGTADAC